MKVKLPRGAFVFRDNFGAELALTFDAVTGGKADLGKVHLESWARFEGEWRPRRGSIITRQAARKLIRRILKAVDTAEALQRGARIVRRGF